MYKLSFYFVPVALLSPYFLGFVDAATTRTISAPPSPTANAASVPADFVGFGFGVADLDKYNMSATENIVNAVASRVSAPIIIRTGGTNGDALVLNSTQVEPVLCYQFDNSLGNCSSGNVSNKNISIGLSYFEGFKTVPSAHRTFQVPLGHNVDKDKIRQFVRLAWDAVTSVGSNRVAAIAIGNEPSVYDSEADYVTAAKEVMQEIVTTLNLDGDNATIFELGDTISHAAESGKPYDVEDIFASGVNDKGWAKFAAEHYYQVTKNGDFTNTPKNLQTYLMNHTAITNHLSNITKTISYLGENFPKVPYVFSETGSALNGLSPNFTNGFGATLWNVDFDLASMARGVARITHALAPPSGGVNARFVATPFVADFIGSKQQPGKVVELNITDAGDIFSAYGIYHGGKLERLAILNLKTWTDGSGQTRVKESFRVQVDSTFTQVQIRRLQAAAGAGARGYDNGKATENVTWAGEQWSININNGKGFFHLGNETVTIKNVTSGHVTVEVEDSEAVMLTMVE